VVRLATDRRETMPYELTDKYADELRDILQAMRHPGPNAAIAEVLDKLYAQGLEDGRQQAIEEDLYEDEPSEDVTTAYERGYDDGVKAYAPWKVLGAVHLPWTDGPAYRLGFEAGWAAEASQAA
jgi:hypothetical protein